MSISSFISAPDASNGIFAAMRVALVHTRLLYRGGLESRLLAYMGYFHAQGHEVTICVYKVDPSVQLPEGVKLKRFKLRWLPKPFRAWAFDKALCKYFRKEKFDFVLSLGRTTCHDAMIVAGNHQGFLEAMGKKGRSLDDKLQIAMDDKAYKAKGVLLPASDMVMAQMQHFHGVPKEKMKVLYPPTNGSRFHSGLKSRKAEFRQKFGFSEGKQSFLLVSANHELKGLPILMEVFKQLQHLPVELLVAGGASFDAGIPNVRHIGFVKPTEEIFAAADFSILASKYDAFGQVVTESLLCGTPAIVSEMTGAKAIVGPNEGIVVEGFGVAEWKNAILQALDAEFNISPDLANEKGLSFEAHMQTLLGLVPKKA